MISSTSKGTLYGIVAIFLWSTIVGLIRNISEYFGAVGGADLHNGNAIFDFDLRGA